MCQWHMFCIRKSEANRGGVYVISKLYLVCLIVGGLFSAVSLLVNGLLDGLDFDMDFDLLSLPLKPFTIMTFITVFGGVGLITEQWLWSWMTLPIAAACAFAASKLIYDLVYLKLRSYETPLKGPEAAIGLRAEVTESIRPESTGKISYRVDGNLLTAPARLWRQGPPIVKGSTVQIKEIEKHIFFVTDKIDLDEAVPAFVREEPSANN